MDCSGDCGHRLKQLSVMYEAGVVETFQILKSFYNNSMNYNNRSKV